MMSSHSLEILTLYYLRYVLIWGDFLQNFLAKLYDRIVQIIAINSNRKDLTVRHINLNGPIFFQSFLPFLLKNNTYNRTNTHPRPLSKNDERNTLSFTVNKFEMIRPVWQFKVR